MTTVQHKFIHTTIETKDNECKDERTAIIVIGNTGVGKSSLINLFCGKDVIIGHDVESCTSQSNLFKDKKHKSRYWLDSKGSNDSNGDSDEKVLKNVMQILYDHKIFSIKIIWCVDSGDICKAGKDIKFQAKFIKSFVGETGWKGCLIIKKMAEPAPKANMDGVIAAAKLNGADIKYGDPRLTGFTYFEGINNNKTGVIKDRALEIISKTTKPNSTKRHEILKEYGYLTKQQICEMITERLSRLQSLRLVFNTQLCENCGCMGDERFVYAPCHVGKEKYHPQYTVQYHKSGVRWIHIGSTVSEQNSDGEYHPGYQEWKTFLGVEVYGTRKYSCCGAKDVDNNLSKWMHGCTTRYSTTWYYSCCGGSTSSSGCTKEYICCKGNEYSTGCQTKYKCCNGNQYSEGCQSRCSNVSCRKEWGSGPGCVKTTNL